MNSGWRSLDFVKEMGSYWPSHAARITHDSDVITVITEISPFIIQHLVQAIHSKIGRSQFFLRLFPRCNYYTQTSACPPPFFVRWEADKRIPWKPVEMQQFEPTKASQSQALGVTLLIAPTLEAVNWPFQDPVRHC